MTWGLTQQDRVLPADIAGQIGGGLTDLDPAVANSLEGPVRDVVLAAYASGFHTLFLFIAGLYVVETILALMLRDVQIPKKAH
jgi:hypothetical protein